MTQTKTRKAPSPGRVEREKQRTVFGMLPEDGSKRRWTDLEKQARNMKMSIRTLKKNLDKLESAGLITRHVDTSKRPPGVYYSKGSIRYAISGPEGGHTYDPKTIIENSLEFYNNKISTLKKESIEEAKQELGEIILLNIHQAFRDTINLFISDIKEQGNIEDFNRCIDVIVHPRLEMLLQLCTQNFDVAEPVRMKMHQQLMKCPNALAHEMGLPD